MQRGQRWRFLACGACILGALGLHRAESLSAVGASAQLVPIVRADFLIPEVLPSARRQAEAAVRQRDRQHLPASTPGSRVCQGQRVPPVLRHALPMIGNKS